MLTMRFELLYTEKADEQLTYLENANDKKVAFKAVRKTLGLMEVNLKHPSLNTLPYHDLEGPNGEKVFESYAQNNTPGAYRVFWHYGPGKGKITIVAIIPPIPNKTN